ncbi:hypothetical protein SAMD00019534_067220 [Acytostelium subglobosum LB1]|uniref:hypothetical protein n=1 Tax=Acytostelium subglobosum LB1 TaxID=1410327 RepID=UPI000644F202|nr:hypothetical protein SAMD00019534_067220 [Acytostelium subglobosum LB1]GAM23547.1 hypothetical protein SAMD00019534_067220 [Acytostelium subglobosum LB1]|eukprot:XP_012753288.1 hypothetical protein SAMD00019534_067220 [Acytostelium subglobosum LB1]
MVVLTNSIKQIHLHNEVLAAQQLQITILDLPIEILLNIFTPFYNDLIFSHDNDEDLTSSSSSSLSSSLSSSTSSAMTTATATNTTSTTMTTNSKLSRYEQYRLDSFRSIISFAQTCKLFYNILQDDSLWQLLYRRHFSFYSQVDVDRICLSNSLSPLLESANRQGDKGCGAVAAPRFEAKEHTESAPWKRRYTMRGHPWSVDDITCHKEIVGGHQLGVTSLEVDDNYLFSGSHDSTIKMYNLDTLKHVHTFQGHELTIWALLSDGKRLYSGSNDHKIRVWDLKRRHCKSILREHNTKIFSLAIKENVLISSGDETIKVWNKKTLVPMLDLKEHTRGVNTMSVHNHHLVSGSSDKTVKIWDLNTMQCVSTKENPATGKVLSMALVDCNTVATGTDYLHINTWDLREHNKVNIIKNAHKWEVWQLHMCGGYLFSGSFDHTIKTWDLRNFQNQRTITGHRSFLHALTSSSYHLFSGSADKYIRVWSPFTT